MSALRRLDVTVFSDYICPFCYVGHHRLMRLRDCYDLRVNWCLLEIHPENSEDGQPVDTLDYSTSHWEQLLHNLKRVAAEENIPLADISFTTNSRNALLLAEACKPLVRDLFYALHEALFRAYFVEQRNIGRRNVLRDIAVAVGIHADHVEKAWNDPALVQRLASNYHSARRYQVQSVPGFVIGERVFTGVVDEQRLRDAAADACDRAG